MVARNGDGYNREESLALEGETPFFSKRKIIPPSLYGLDFHYRYQLYHLIKTCYELVIKASYAMN